MLNISHFRSILMLPLMIFFNIKTYYRNQKFFLFSTFVFCFWQLFFHFPTLVSKHFLLQFPTFEFVWIVDIFSTLRTCLSFQKLRSQQFLLSFQLMKIIFLKTWIFYIFSLLFHFLQAVFNLGAFLSLFGSFFVFLTRCSSPAVFVSLPQVFFSISRSLFLFYWFLTSLRGFFYIF